VFDDFSKEDVNPSSSVMPTVGDVVQRDSANIACFDSSGRGDRFDRTVVLISPASLLPFPLRSELVEFSSFQFGRGATEIITVLSSPEENRYNQLDDNLQTRNHHSDIGRHLVVGTELFTLPNRTVLDAIRAHYGMGGRGSPAAFRLSMGHLRCKPDSGGEFTRMLPSFFNEDALVEYE
jgi:hypothetical protein